MATQSRHVSNLLQNMSSIISLVSHSAHNETKIKCIHEIGHPIYALFDMGTYNH